MTKLSPIRCLIALAAAAVLAGCGVKGPPELPGDTADTFPTTYPAGAVPPDVPPTNIYIERWLPR
jgi:predicted small lipoprotein YifL